MDIWKKTKTNFGIPRTNPNPQVPSMGLCQDTDLEWTHSYVLIEDTCQRSSTHSFNKQNRTYITRQKPNLVSVSFSCQPDTWEEGNLSWGTDSTGLACGGMFLNVNLWRKDRPAGGLEASKQAVFLVTASGPALTSFSDGLWPGSVSSPTLVWVSVLSQQRDASYNYWFLWLQECFKIGPHFSGENVPHIHFCPRRQWDPMLA